MMSLKAYAATACLGLASFALAPNALADTWNKKTILTISEPIQVPGKVLQPGKYVMRLLDSPSNRHIVQIFNEREDQLQTTILAIPNYRLQPTGKTEFQWWETPVGQPKALRAWFYPGDNFGQEFAYPKNTAVQIAQYTKQTVPTTYAEKETELATARVGTVDRAGTEMELDRQTYSRADMPKKTPAAAPARQTEIAQNTAPAAQATEQPMPVQTRARRLPKTASPFPMIGLAGFFALGTSIALRALAKRA
jgi:hypothetical protein